EVPIGQRLGAAHPGCEVAQVGVEQRRGDVVYLVQQQFLAPAVTSGDATIVTPRVPVVKDHDVCGIDKVGIVLVGKPGGGRRRADSEVAPVAQAPDYVAGAL